MRSVLLLLRTRFAVCGPLALRHIARRMGVSARLHDIAVVAGTGRDGTSLLGLKRAAAALGLEGQMLRTNYAGLLVLPKPCIAHMRSGHYEVVQRCQENRLTLGGLLKRRKDAAVFLEEWSSAVLVLQAGFAKTREGSQR
jgi:ABC-type bacteriocin/lantibiotic exporter with double-glycine peptidase domain